LTATRAFRPLTRQEIATLRAQGCSSTTDEGADDDFAEVQVAGEGFDAARVTQSRFIGPVRLGANGGSVRAGAGRAVACGVHRAVLSHTTVGDGVLVAQVGGQIANYDIEDGAILVNVGVLETRPGAAFGNGIAIEVLNEGGGREVVLFNGLSSQFAYLVCLHRYRGELQARLAAIARAEAARAMADRGRIGPGAVVVNVPEMIDVQVGPAAIVRGATSLVNGTILSATDAPTTIGAGVQARDFIVAEGTQVDGGAMLTKSYVGQGCRIGRQYSAEGSVFFANCEGFHGEAVSIFAGPYTVSHHKSTLMIAGLFSFYNAGSGTNQSNHMYKLGPVHEGKLERGCKTGSFSYLMWPCRVGPFSVVLGKHTRTFDTSELPFSLIEAKADGRCTLVPGINLATVGTVRDGGKWPTRDRRSGRVKRDRISFDVFSPYTVGRMIRGSALLQELSEATDRAIDTVSIKGADVKRVLLRTGVKFYRPGIENYLLEKVVVRVEAARAAGVSELTEALAEPEGAVYDLEWVDIGGLLMPRARLEALCADLASGRLADLAAFEAALDRIAQAYPADEWLWVRQAIHRVLGVDLDRVGAADLARLADLLQASLSKFLNLILVDAQKEFDELTRTGFGQDGGPAAVAADFAAVRGPYDENRFVREMRQRVADLQQRVAAFKQALGDR